MDFQLSEEQQALAGLASSVFGDHVTHERLRELEASSASVFDRVLWSACSQAGLLGTVVPELHGGAGLGLLELLPVLEEQGRRVAPIPLVETLVLGALGLVEFGSAQQQAALLPGVATGEVVLTAAFAEGVGGDPSVPVMAAEATADGWLLDGDLDFVTYAAQATRVLVPAQTSSGTIVVLLDPTAVGVELTELVATNRQPQARMELRRVTVSTGDVVAGPDRGQEMLVWLAQRASAAWCAVQAGVCDGAVRMTAAYTSQRKQFDKPIAEFQAVAQRAADAFIDSEMVGLTARHAVYRLSQNLECAREVHVAKFWAGDGGMRAVHAAQHLHGGIGVDLDYPVHRYFLWAKRIEHTLGTPTRELLRLGNILADEPV
ncbi:MAG: alkylation response protein AidB-like acyl-CoA dehydrogenase [Glaciecola sp.]|jgi:alkylation response protein AidB-like acyl-CoA dehydrogenase